jgi:diguanylate cyclase (GGDEF)-like protein
MRNKHQLGLGTGFVLLLTLMVVLLVHGLLRLGSISRDLNQIVDLHGRKVAIVTDIQLAGYHRTGALSALVLAGSSLEGAPVTRDLAELESRIYDGWTALRLLGLSPDESANLNRQAALVARMHALQLEVVHYKEAGQNAMANAVLRQELIPLQRALAAELQMLRTLSDASIAEAVRNARATREFTQKFTIHLGFFCVLLGVIVAMTVTRRMMRQNRAIERYIRLLSSSRDAHRHLATHDPLTSMPNRVLFQDRLDQALLRSRRKRERFAVAFLDLDNFKLINDRHGHHAGDQILKGAAERLNAGLRQSDTVARMGGDEFAALLEGLSSRHEADRVIQTLAKQLAAPFLVDGTEIRLSMSVGIAYYPLDGSDAESLLKVADRAMYRMKAQTRVNELPDTESKPVRAEPEPEASPAAPRAVDGGLQWQ